MQPKIVSETELCSMLKRSQRTIRRFRSDPNDPLPCLKVGRSYVYDPDKVWRYLEQRAERERRARPVPVRGQKTRPPRTPNLAPSGKTLAEMLAEIAKHFDMGAHRRACARLRERHIDLASILASPVQAEEDS